MRRSIARCSPTQARARAFSLGKLAILELNVGDASQGLIHGERALSAEAPLKSRRAKDDLAEIRRALGRRADVTGAAESRSRLTQVLKSA
ncbi:hypothetical protein [Actinoalloteichus caeruleus]|uniref:Uncharacterized protein n=1 Tax=Actinoalloteichus caeruleus DSM 43889 TaxID=1120930 RepID=A0ABT1JIK1_ACTCY|nr:hypothetical protein [Actinoalloteichus caeruleus DSM 43889]